jgi:hypothetical protein
LRKQFFDCRIVDGTGNCSNDANAINLIAACVADDKAWVPLIPRVPVSACAPVMPAGVAGTADSVGFDAAVPWSVGTSGSEGIPHEPADPK